MSDASPGPAPNSADILQELRAAGAAMDRFDDATLQATAAVHRTFLARLKATYLGPVDPANWARLPVAMEMVLGAWPRRIEQLCLVVPWTPSVTPAAADYLRIVKRARGKSELKTVLLVTSEKLTEKEVAQLGRDTGYLVTALHAPSLELIGPPRAQERIPKVIDDLSLTEHADVDVGAGIVAHNAELNKADRFHEMLDATTPTTWVAPLVLGLNVLVFVAMVATGSHWASPSTSSVFFWGGAYGPNVVNGEWWRLLTANYVHFGILHLGFNMWCLWQVGRFTERLLGNWAFLLAYTFSGLGGAIASIARNPFGIGAGASGAVFGVFGCILGFMLVRRRTVPVLVFKPLVWSVLAFVGYNLGYGLTQPFIDNAAHVGGLVIGFLCGMLLSRKLPVPEGGASRLRYLYSLVVVAVLVAGGAFAAARVPEEAPMMAPALGGMARAYNEFIGAVAPSLAEYRAVRVESQKLLVAVTARRMSKPVGLRYAASLTRSAFVNHERLRKTSVPHEELAALHKHLLAALSEQVKGMAALARAIEHNEASNLEAFKRHTNAANAHFLEFARAHTAFLQRHRFAPGGRR